MNWPITDRHICDQCELSDGWVPCPIGGEALRATDADPFHQRRMRITFLERKREATKADLLLKFEDGDWHGVCDAGMDLRDIDSELKGLRL